MSINKLLGKLNSSLRSLSRYIWRYIKKIIIITGILVFIIIFFSFTSGPFWIYHWLGTHDSQFPGQPDYIIVLGGGGMPSESSLIRCYHAAHLAYNYPEAKVIIALPADSLNEDASIIKMQNELLMRGVDSSSFYLEYQGRNTRAQALNIKSMCKSLVKDTFVIVTSPEHMLRSIKTFRKAGYKNIGGYAAFEYAIESDITFEDKILGGNRKYVPKIGKNINLRYRFWTHLEYNVLILREFCAIAFYKIKGWI